MLRIFWLITTLFLANLATATAKEFNDSSVRGFGGLSVETEVKTKLGSLYDEPVINASFRWKLKGGTYQKVQLPSATSYEDVQSYELDDFGSETLGRVKIYNVTFALVIDRRNELSFGTGVECILVDGGAAAVGDGQTWSFNVSGSPNWDRLLTDCLSVPGFSLETHELPTSIDRDNLEYIESDRAKRVFKALLDGSMGLKRIIPVAGEISYRELESWFVKTYKPQIVAGKLKALQTLEKGLKESFDLELPKPTTESIVKDLQKDYYAIETLNKRITTVDRRIQKLQNLPAEFMVGREKYAQVYEKSKQDSRRLLETAQQRYDTWRSSLKEVVQEAPKNPYLKPDCKRIDDKNLCGFVDALGNTVIHHQFIEVSEFKNGTSEVVLSREVEVIRTSTCHRGGRSRYRDEIGNINSQGEITSSSSKDYIVKSSRDFCLTRSR